MLRVSGPEMLLLAYEQQPQAEVLVLSDYWGPELTDARVVPLDLLHLALLALRSEGLNIGRMNCATSLPA